MYRIIIIFGMNDAMFFATECEKRPLLIPQCHVFCSAISIYFATRITIVPIFLLDINPSGHFGLLVQACIHIYIQSKLSKKHMTLPVESEILISESPLDLRGHNRSKGKSIRILPCQRLEIKAGKGCMGSPMAGCHNI